LGEADNPAGDSGASISRLLALLRRAALTKIVLVGVDDDRATENARLPVQSDAGVLESDGGAAGAIRADVAQVSRVTLAVFGTSMFVSLGVPVGACRGAAVGVIAKFVNVKPVQTFSEASDLTLDLHRTVGSVLRQVDHSFDDVTSQNANCFDYHLSRVSFVVVFL